jgi:hypothetical protein
MSASIASAVAGATTFSTSPAAKSVWLDEKLAVVPAAELSVPMLGLRGGVVEHALDAVDNRTGVLGLYRDGSPVRQTDEQIGAAAVNRALTVKRQRPACGWVW